MTVIHRVPCDKGYQKHLILIVIIIRLIIFIFLLILLSNSFELQVMQRTLHRAVGYERHVEKYYA